MDLERRGRRLDGSGDPIDVARHGGGRDPSGRPPCVKGSKTGLALAVP